MTCCGGGSGFSEDDDEGVSKNRRCRDVFCLLFFIVFWIGMFAIAGAAYKQGDMDRLVYGTDSLGLTCGGNYTLFNKTLDLTEMKNLYYLDPMELLSVYDIPFARKICVSSCPGNSTCGIGSLPCTNNAAFRCPYYVAAEDNLYGSMPGLNLTDVMYFANLSSIKSVTDENAQDIISTLESLNITWVHNWLAVNNISSNSPTVSGAYYQLLSQFPGAGPCYPVWVPTNSYYNRCVPDFPQNFTDNLVKYVDGLSSGLPASVVDAWKDAWQTLSQRFTRYISDIQKGVLIIMVAGLLSSLVLSLVYMVLLRYAAGLVVWLTLLLVNLSLMGITFYCFAMAGLLGDSSWAHSITTTLGSFGNPNAVDEGAWKAIAIVSAVVCVAVFILTALMVSRIAVAVACIKVAGQAVGAMPLVLFFPIIPFILMLFLVLYWVSVAAMLYTAGDLAATCRDPASVQPLNWEDLASLNTSLLVPRQTAYVDCYSNITGQDLQKACAQDPNCFMSYKWNDKLRYAAIYHLFGLLWTQQFITGINCVTVAGAIAEFYFAGGDSSKLPNWPVARASWNCFIYHLGSIAFGSVVIAIIQLVRLFLEYLDRRSKELQEANKCAEWAMCCCKCLMWCIEKVVAFINRNAYIMIAIKGSNYCSASFSALQIIVANALRLVAVNVVGDLLLFLGKAAVAASCGVIAFFLTDLDYYRDPIKYPRTYLSSPFMPVALSALIGFTVAQVFFSVFEMAIDTILLCFCEDCSKNNGEPKYAPPLLMEAVGADPSKSSKSMPSGNKVAPQPAKR